jgi:hypothetical protein
LLTAGLSSGLFGLSASLSLGMALVLASACGRQRTLTYYDDVAPVLADHCVDCHRNGGVAPTPPLETYEQARSAAGKLRLAVQSRDMPPWGADNGGLCGTWHRANWLTAREIQTLVGWASDPKSGNQERTGSLRRQLPIAFRPSGIVLDTGADWSPGLGASAYRCFVVDPRLSGDRLVTAFRILSTEPRSVAQVTVYGIDSPEAEQVAVELDVSDSEAGYSCYGSSRILDARLLMSWTWDASVLRLPEGTGVRLRAGRKLVVQIHYNPIATGLNVPTRTRIELEDAVGVKEVSFVPIAPASFRLPQALGRTQAKGETLLSRPVTVLGVAPRMHTLGKTMQLDVVRKGAASCAANFDHWSFYRQRLFLYTQPLRVEAGDVLRVSCIYDTHSRSEPTEMGERIDQEECLASLLVTE